MLSNSSEGRHSFCSSFICKQMQFLISLQTRYVSVLSMMILKWGIHHFPLANVQYSIRWFKSFKLHIFTCSCCCASVDEQTKFFNFLIWYTVIVGGVSISLNDVIDDFLDATFLLLVLVILLQDKLDSLVRNELATTRKTLHSTNKRLESWLLFMI